MGEKGNVYRDLVGKREANRALGRRRCRWKDNIEVHLKKIDLEGVD
jgi:hypothetical protein